MEGDEADKYEQIRHIAGRVSDNIFLAVPYHRHAILTLESMTLELLRRCEHTRIFKVE